MPAGHRLLVGAGADEDILDSAVTPGFSGLHLRLVLLSYRLGGIPPLDHDTVNLRVQPAHGLALTAQHRGELAPGDVMLLARGLVGGGPLGQLVGGQPGLVLEGRLIAQVEVGAEPLHVGGVLLLLGAAGGVQFLVHGRFVFFGEHGTVLVTLVEEPVQVRPAVRRVDDGGDGAVGCREHLAPGAGVLDLSPEGGHVQQPVEVRLWTGLGRIWELDAGELQGPGVLSTAGGLPLAPVQS